MVGTIPSEIPVLDLSIVSGKYEDLDNSAFEKLGEEFGKAMSTVGFAYIVNHGFDMEKVR
jgi:isopenicillin N synthase-like dioxygenase